MKLKVSNFRIRAQEMIIVPLDVETMEEAKQIVRQHASEVWGFKVGLKFLMANGAKEIVDFIHDMGSQVFLDGKFHDIPNTIKGASEVVTNANGNPNGYEVEMFNVHGASGTAGMLAAVEAAKGTKSLVLTVTVLTSHNDEESVYIFGAPSQKKVLQFAFDALKAGCDGIICSPQEAKLIRKYKELDELIVVTPGIRPLWAATNDQKRVMTPAEAVLEGVNLMVIGRPILEPPQGTTPIEAREMIIDETAQALARRELLRMSKTELLELESIDWRLSFEEFEHIAKEMGIFWSFNYEAAKQGRPGRHAQLKFGGHSDVFVNIKELLEYDNIRSILANQILMIPEVKEILENDRPDYIVGIPDGATKLCQEIGNITGIKVAEMKKVDGVITLITDIEPGATIVAFEDMRTHGTSLLECHKAIMDKQPKAKIILKDIVVFNRGGLKIITTAAGDTEVIAVIEKEFHDWPADKCPLCQDYGSEASKPKETDTSFDELIHSQDEPCAESSNNTLHESLD